MDVAIFRLIPPPVDILKGLKNEVNRQGGCDIFKEEIFGGERREKGEIAVQKKRKLLKLANKGSTCYISSTIQLMYCAHLHSSSLLFSLFNITPLATSLSSLFSSYSSSNGEMEKEEKWIKLLEEIYKALPQFKPKQQSDSAVCFSSFILSF